MENKVEEKNKLSYENLENVAHQLSEQSRNLYAQNQKLKQALEEANLSNYFKRLDYLWSIVTSVVSEEYITKEFKIKCGKEFMEMMTPPEKEEEND